MGDGGRREVRRSRAVCLAFRDNLRQPEIRDMAEGAGFEPAMELPPYTLSRRAPSTARPPLRNAPQAGSQRDSSGAPRRVQRGPDTSLPGREQGPRHAADNRPEFAGKWAFMAKPRFPAGPVDARGRPHYRPAPSGGEERTASILVPRVQVVPGVRSGIPTRQRTRGVVMRDMAMRPFDPLRVRPLTMDNHA